MALTRRVIERQLDTLTQRVPHAWWTPWAAAAAALTVGVVLSRVPFLRLVGVGARAARAGIGVVGLVAAVDRLLGARHRPPGA